MLDMTKDQPQQQRDDVRTQVQVDVLPFQLRLWDPADISSTKEEEHEHRPQLGQTDISTKQRNATAVFLAKGVNERDITPLELLKAGDIE